MENNKDDSNQNPELNKDVTIEEGKVTLPQEIYNEIIESQAILTQDKSNLVNEIKDLREKKQLTDDEKVELTNKVTKLEEGITTETKVEVDEVKTTAEQIVNQIFAKKDAESREEAMQKAMKNFVQSNPQFSSENDEAGLKKSAFEKKLNTFNMESCKSQEDFLSIFKDANRLLGGTETKVEEQNNIIHQSTDSYVKPKETDVHELSTIELKVINQFMEGDKDRYIKIKSKRPDYVASLLRNVY